MTKNAKNDISIDLKESDLAKITQDIKIKFKTFSSTAQYVYQRNQSMYPGKVAVMAQFMPTFAEQQSTDDGSEVAFTNDEDDLEEEQTKEGLDHKLCFVFVVDRSGSMGYPALRI